MRVCRKKKKLCKLYMPLKKIYVHSSVMYVCTFMCTLKYTCVCTVFVCKFMHCLWPVWEGIHWWCFLSRLRLWCRPLESRSSLPVGEIESVGERGRDRARPGVWKIVKYYVEERASEYVSEIGRMWEGSTESKADFKWTCSRNKR